MPALQSRKAELESISSRLGRTTIEISDLCKSYGDKVLVKDYTYFFLKDDRICYIGPNGSGKSTLMKMIAGWVKPDSGTIEIGQTVKLGYFSQENEDMDTSLKVIDYIKNFIPTVCPVYRDREAVRRREKTSLSFKDPQECTECPDPGRADE